MSKEDVDAYVAALDEPKRSTLEKLRRTILQEVPDAVSPSIGRCRTPL